MSVNVHNTSPIVRSALLTFAPAYEDGPPFVTLDLAFYGKDGERTESWTLLMSPEAVEAVREALDNPRSAVGAPSLPHSLPVPVAAVEPPSDMRSLANDLLRGMAMV